MWLTNNTYGLWKWKLGNHYSEIESAQITFQGITAKTLTAVVVFSELQTDEIFQDETKTCSPDLIGFYHQRKKIFSWNAIDGDVTSFNVDAKSLLKHSEIVVVATTTEEVEVATQHHPSLSPTLTINYRQSAATNNQRQPSFVCGDYLVAQGEQCDSSFGCSVDCECISPLFVPSNGVCIRDEGTTLEIITTSGDKSFGQNIATSAGVYLIAYGGGTCYVLLIIRRCKC